MSRLLAKLRDLAAFAVGFLVVVAMAAVALEVTTDAKNRTDEVHREDFVSNEVVLAGLTRQFFQLAFKDAFDTASWWPWTLVPGDAGDRRGLAQFTEKSALLRDNALLVGLDGTVINSATDGPLPGADDPAFEPMRAALMAGGPGLSGMLTTAADPMVAMGVPVMRKGEPIAVFVGLFRPATSPLQSYVESLDTRAGKTMTVDGSGTVVVHSDRRKIGTKVTDRALLEQFRRGGRGFVEFDRDGEEMVAAVAPLELDGWAGGVEARASTFYGPTRTGLQRLEWALLGILVAAGGALLIANHRTANARRRGEDRFRVLVQHSTDGVVVVDASGTILFETPAMDRLLGPEPGGRVGRSAFVHIHPDDVERAGVRLAALTEEPDREIIEEFRVVTKAGETRVVEIHARNLLSHNAVQGIVVNFRDVTERRALDEHLRHIATHDDLTNLPNRALFNELMGAAASRSRRRGTSMAVLFLDLDRFKLVNDSFGHEFGDAVLQAVARRLQRALRDHDVLARISGDEFAVLLDDITDESNAVRVASRIIDDFRLPFNVDGAEVFVGVSIGVALADEASTPDALIRHADMAMYLAKENGRLRFEMFAEDMGERSRQRLRLEADLRRALDRNEFALHYQPKVRLSDGEIIGFEALVRWNHPERGLLAPNHFIGAAEDTGLIHELGAWVLEEAARQAVRWRKAGGRPMQMSVNLSGRQIQRGREFVDAVAVTLLRTGVDASFITLEITESVLMDDTENTIATLASLRDLGVGLAIDDFGTGYSSLAYLKHFPVTSLKLDRSFVHGLADDEADSAIAESMIRLAHALGLEVTAEGVELPEQEARLRQFNCDDAQGFLFARPLNVVEAAKLIDLSR